MKYTSYVTIAVRKTQSEALRTAVSKMPVPLLISPETNRIIIKPSIYNPDLPGNTSLGMMKAVVAFFKDVAPLSVVESDNPLRSAEAAFSGCKFNSIEQQSLEFINLSNQPSDEQQLAGHHLTAVKVPRMLLQHHFLVNLATIKKQDEISFSGCIKNLFGLLPQKDKDVFHGVLNEVLVDLLLFFKPRLNIIDLTYLIKGDRTNLEQRQVDGVVIGTDAVAVDAYCSSLLGIDPMEVPYIRKAYDLGIGEALLERIQVFGTEHQKKQISELCS